MNTARIRTVTRRLAARPDRGTPPAADAALLARFLDTHDESAFEVLVSRHLAAVRAVCASLLRDPNDVDDATQATFLVLVRRSSAVRDHDALGRWLCRVAWRTANRLRAANARRAARRVGGLDPDATPAPAPGAGRAGAEIAAALADEIRRLPEKYRLAVLTCYAAGTPTAEAAAQLGWPKGTLLTRLAWARKRLRDRLTKRGLAPAGGFAAAFSDRPGADGAAVLAGRITTAAVADVGGLPVAGEVSSERVRSLTEGVVRTMIGTKLKMVLGVTVLAVAVLGLGLGRLTVGTADAAGPPDKKLATGSPLAPGNDPKEKAARPEAEPDKADATPAGPGTDLVVRRPLGSYTREVAPYWKATMTFTENRIHLVANVLEDKVSFTVTADADYSMNRESMVYGIITGADVPGPLSGGDVGPEDVVEIGLIVGKANDTPFAFRVRVEDEAITIKDIKFGPVGSPLFGQLLGEKGGDKKTLLTIAGMVVGRYKADATPDRGQDLHVPVAPPVKAKRK